MIIALLLGKDDLKVRLMTDDSISDVVEDALKWVLCWRCMVIIND